MEQQTFDRDTGIIDGLIGLFLLSIADFTAIAVDSEADAVDKLVILLLDCNSREVDYILVDRNQGLCIAADAGDEIVSCTDSISCFIWMLSKTSITPSELMSPLALISFSAVPSICCFT